MVSRPLLKSSLTYFLVCCRTLLPSTLPAPDPPVSPLPSSLAHPIAMAHHLFHDSLPPPPPSITEVPPTSTPVQGEKPAEPIEVVNKPLEDVKVRSPPSLSSPTRSRANSSLVRSPLRPFPHANTPTRLSLSFTSSPRQPPRYPRSAALVLHHLPPPSSPRTRRSLPRPSPPVTNRPPPVSTSSHPPSPYPPSCSSPSSRSCSDH